MGRMLTFLSGVKHRGAAKDVSVEKVETPLVSPPPLSPSRRPASIALPSIGENAEFSSPRGAIGDYPLSPTPRTRRASALSTGSTWSSWSSSESGSSSRDHQSLPSLAEPLQNMNTGKLGRLALPTDYYKRLTKLSTAHGNRFPMCFPRSVKRSGLYRIVTSIFLDVFPGEIRDANTSNRVLTHAVTGMGAAETKEESKNEAARSALRQLCVFAAETCVDFSSDDTDEALPHIRKLFRSVARHILGARASFEVHERTGRGIQRLFQAEIMVWSPKSRKHRARKGDGTTLFSDMASSRAVATRLGLHAGFEWAAQLLD